MSSKQARLIAAVADAINAQGITQRELAQCAGTSASQLSLAMGGKTQMSEEKWRMICERLGLDFDEVIADPEPEETELESAAERQSEAGDACERATIYSGRIRCEREQRANVLADYAERKIGEDIRAGVNVEQRDMWKLLEAVRELRGGWK